MTAFFHEYMSQPEGQMQEHSVVKKRSVAELAGKFNCPIPHTTDAEVNKPVRRRPPRTLPLPASNDAGQGQDEKGAETASPRKNRNSALIEKLQANLALSPTGQLPFPKCPGVLKLPVPSFSPGSPSSPSSPPVTVTPKQEETPASFENPSEGAVLKSIIKGRARHSIKRRPPSRRHRKSSADEEVDKTDSLEHTTPNGHEGNVFEEQKTSLDTESLSSKEEIEQETKSTDSEKAEPEEKVETVTSEKKEEEEKTEQEEEKIEQEEEKTEQEEEKIEQEEEKTEQKEEKTEQEEEKTGQEEEKTGQEEEKTGQEEEKTEQEEEKTEQELKEEKSEAEPQLDNSTEETHEEPVTETHGKPQAEPDTTDEKEEEQKEDEVNH